MLIGCPLTLAWWALIVRHDSTALCKISKVKVLSLTTDCRGKNQGQVEYKNESATKVALPRQVVTLYSARAKHHLKLGSG